MSPARTFVYCCLSLVVSARAFPYELETHADMSGAALQASTLNQPSSSVLSDLGLEESINVELQFPDSNGTPSSIVELFRTGARSEDSGIRPRNHFFNPLNNAPLTIPGIPLFNFTSPDWALEDNGQITGVLGIGSQEFSFADARRYLLQALTSSSESDRKVNYGRMFQTLGQVIHHIQDMAQPQHVRNDPHWDQLSLFGLNPLFNPSSYEKWAERDIVRGTLKFSGYAPPYSAADRTTFNVARNLWHTPDGKGLADYTNHNFVSAGTNFDKPGLFPSPIPSSTSTTTLQELCLNANPPCPSGVSQRLDAVTFFGNTVQDNVLGPSADQQNPRASTYSIFDQDLIARGGQPVFSLNQFNFKAASEFLIPRAVAYSAGMINYFFRGKIDLVPDDATPTFVIKNLGSEAMSGTFSLYYDDAGNNRTLFATLYNGPIAANGQQPIGTLPDPATLHPAPKKPDEYMLVFTGSMGAETAAQPGIGAVVGKAVSLQTIIDLGFVVRPNDINNSGQVVGVIGGGHAFLWSSGSGIQDLGTLPGGIFSEATSINDNGQVAGFSTTFDGQHPFVWSSTLGMQDLGNTPGGDGFNQALGINNLGQVVGYGEFVVGLEGVDRAFIWSPASGMQDLGFGLGGGIARPAAINNQGQIAGSSNLPHENPRPVMWPGPVDLGIPFGQASSINDSGQIVGTDGNRAFLWSPSSGLQDLGFGDGSVALDINNAGQVVGTGRGRALLRSNGTVTDLNTLPGVQAAGWSLEIAQAINDAGQIVGLGSRNGFFHGFLLKGIPK